VSSSRGSRITAFAASVAALVLVGCEAGEVPSPDASRDARADVQHVNDARFDAAPDDRPVPPTDAPDDSPAVDTISVPDVVSPLDAPRDASGIVCPSTSPRDCSPGTGTGMADQCFRGTSCYLTQVQNAVRRTIDAHPTWFRTDAMIGCSIILDVPSYMNAVVSDLVGQGLCAIRDPNAPDEEVTVKHDNAFSENFDIVASTGCARYGALIYTGYCMPAWW